jgi:hypothetical protein
LRPVSRAMSDVKNQGPELIEAIERLYFEREGTYSEEMELIFEEFELTEIL